MEIPILFENADVIAANKPEGLTSIPGSERGKDTLLSLLSKQFGHKLFVVHRLDKGVSGVMLFAKNAAAHKFLNDQFSSHTVKKTYLALVHGVPAPQQGVISRPIHQFGSGRMGVDELRGKASATEYGVVEKIGDCSLVEAHPRTGRKHQLRVHFYSIGHPVAGDGLYGDKTAQAAFTRMMLHAKEITFKLPSGETKTIEAPVPESFSSVVTSLQKR
jgi:tRNA pseudouridine32 synthase / 23S rRNA pseudouridine746 synthase